MPIQLRYFQTDANGAAHFKREDDDRKPGPSIYVLKSFIAESFGNLSPKDSVLTLTIEPLGRQSEEN